MGKETWLWLVDGLGYGAVNTGELLAAYPGGAEEIAEDLGGERLDEILTLKQAEKLASSRPTDYALRLAHAETMGVVALPFDDPNYPDMLRSITNPPPLLFVKGDLSLLNGQLSIGVVGARRPSAYGVEAVKAIGRGVALGGAIIVSGLAGGLDSEAHKAALAVNGPTIACIAFGHDTCYPASNKKLMELIERYGAVVSEYPIGTGPEKPYFLHRNRLIAGLSHGLVVGEARKQSGTMSTVNFATDYGRDVFAVPGSIFSELSGGTNAMIREGAYLAGSATDILSVYGIDLLDEDPVLAAAKQAAEGRPEPAPASAPWQQSTARQAVLFEEHRAETLATQKNNRSSNERDAARQPSDRDAIAAFRRLQEMTPADDDSELDARNHELDEMVNAVEDQVELNSIRRPFPQPRSKDSSPRIIPFRWDRVEHLNSKDLTKKTEPREEPERRESSEERRSGPVERREGQFERREGPFERRDITAGPVNVPVERRSGTAERRDGPMERRDGPIERRSAFVERRVEPPRASQTPVSTLSPSEAPALSPTQPSASSAPASSTAPPAPLIAKAPASAPSPVPSAAETPATSSSAPAVTLAEAPPLPPASTAKSVTAPPAPGAAASVSSFAKTTEPAPAPSSASASQPLAAVPSRPAAPERPAVSSAAQTPSIPPRLESTPQSASLASKLRTLQPTSPSVATQEKPLATPAQEKPLAIPRKPEPPTERGEPGLPKNASRLTFGSPLFPPPARPSIKRPERKRENVSLFSAPVRRDAAATKTTEKPGLPPDLDMDEVEAAAPNPLEMLSDAALRAYAQLSIKPVSLAKICEGSGLSSGEAMAALTELELTGLSRQLAGRQFVVMQ